MIEKPETYQWAVDGPPIGVWKTNSGSATFLMSSVLTISPNGVGTRVDHSRLFADFTTSLFWRMLVPGELQLFESDEDYPRPVYDNDWSVFRYRADWKVYDIGAGPVLINDGIEEEGGIFPKNGFWMFDSPVELIGRAE